MINIILYILYFVKYILFTRYILDKEIRRWWIAGISISVWGILCVAGVVTDGTLLYFYSIAVLGSLFFMIKEIFRKKIIEIFLTYIIINGFGDILSTIIYMINRIKKGNLYFDTNMDNIICNIIIIFFVMFFSIIKEKKGNIKEKKIPESAAYIAISITVWMVNMVITSLHFFQLYFTDKEAIIIMHIVEIMALISVFILIMLVYYIYNMNRHIQRINENEREARVMQKMFYEKLLEKEEDTRKFRHDMSNQLIYLQALLENGKTEELKKHMELLNHSMKEIHEKVYVTGNDMLDIMINYYKDHLNKETQIRVLGGMSGNIKADSVEQCVIFSNVIKNAIEEINRGEFEKPFITIKIENGEEMVGIIVENSSEEKKNKKGKFQTSKRDIKNHGIGTSNIKETVKKCKGVCILQYENGTFTSKIYLPRE